MKPSSQEAIESILSALEHQGPGAAPVEEALALATSDPDAVLDLAVATMRRYPQGGTYLDGALRFLPESRWPAAIAVALDTLESGDDENEAADSVIAYASLQAPSALHPHLDRIFALRTNENSYDESYPWRESGDQHFEFLRNVLENSDSQDDRRRAWEAMLQTRHLPMLEHAISQTASITPAHFSGREAEWLTATLQPVGFDLVDGKLERTCPDALYHLKFPDGYFNEELRPAWLPRTDATWSYGTDAQPVSLGGSCDSVCLRCEEKLHRLLALEPVPAALKVTQLSRLELATCLSCLGWEVHELFYQHDETGRPTHAFYDEGPGAPQFPVGPLKEVEARLEETPRRWYWQDWALSNSRENLNRVGGEPTWIQDAEYPNCPACERRMNFLLQLDSDLPTADGGEWMWGSGGIGYGFWCDACKVSGFLWQCT